jgi:hypothetical protein
MAERNYRLTVEGELSEIVRASSDVLTRVPQTRSEYDNRS